MKLLLGLVIGLAAIASLDSCSAEVGNQYNGESLLSLHGTVASNGNATADAVPVLGFENAAGLHVLDGFVKGEFPTKFSFDVTELPPESVFSELVFKGQQGPIALGTVRMVPRDHHSFYEKLTTERTWNGDGLQFIETQCDRQGLCLSHQFVCIDEPCAIVSSTGDTELANLDREDTVSRFDGLASGTEYVGIRTYYDTENLDHNYRVIRDCDLSGLQRPGGVVGDGTSVRRCSKVDELPTTTLIDYNRAFWGASNLAIIYASQDEPSWEYGPLRKGYNVLASPVLERASLVANLNCLEDALLTASKEFSTEVGSIANLPFDDPEREPKLDQPRGAYYHRVWELQQQCPSMPRLAVVSDPTRQSLDISLSPIGLINY